MRNGITSNTPENILFGAGTIHKNLAYGYTETSDTSPVSGKSYYTRSGSAGSYTYTAFSGSSFAAGTTYYERGWNFNESLIGATAGGSKLDIVPEYTDIPVDGALVKVKELAIKTGETAKMEINFRELTSEIIVASIGGEQAATSDIEGYNKFQSKAAVSSGAFFNNIAFVGESLDGRALIAILKNALCTSGLSLDNKTKEGTVIKATFECYATISEGVEKLPYVIYWENN